MIYTVKFLSPFYVLPGAKNAKPWGKKNRYHHKYFGNYFGDPSLTKLENL